jgi:hypothetical protein
MTHIIEAVDTDCRLLIKYLPGNLDSEAFNFAPFYNSQLNLTGLAWGIDGGQKSLAFGLSDVITVVSDSVQSTYFNPTAYTDYTIFLKIMLSSGTTTGNQRIFTYINGADLFVIRRNGSTLTIILTVGGVQIFGAGSAGPFTYNTYYNVAVVKKGTSYGLYADTGATLTQRTYASAGASGQIAGGGSTFIGAASAATSFYGSMKMIYAAGANTLGAAPNVGRTDVITVPTTDIFTLYNLP